MPRMTRIPKMINYSKVLSDLKAEDNLFVLTERPHGLAWRQFTCCDKAHEGVIHLQHIIFVQEKKKEKRKLEFFMQTSINQHQVFIFLKPKKIHDASISQKKRKKRGSSLWRPLIGLFQESFCGGAMTSAALRVSI